MEESNQWRHPVDLIEILVRVFEELPRALEARANREQRRRGAAGNGGRAGAWDGRARLVPVLLGEDAQAIADALLEALRQGATEDDLAGTVTYAAALRIAQFPMSNEFGDWDTALHTFTFANAVQQGLRRAPSIELLRGVFDAAASVYLDRFLNVPPVRLPDPAETGGQRFAGAKGEEALHELTMLLDRQQQVNDAGRLVARYLYGGGEAARLIATLGRLLLREDRNFHTIQTIEAAVRQFGAQAVAHDAVPVLVAAARYLAAHSPTVRAQGQTYRIAQRLHRGENVFEGNGEA